MGGGAWENAEGGNRQGQSATRRAGAGPAVAARAGVTPSTIYRRWGTLSQLLSDVALEKLRPETAPVDTGSLKGDLTLWLEHDFEGRGSCPGGARIRDRPP